MSQTYFSLLFLINVFPYLALLVSCFLLPILFKPLCIWVCVYCYLLFLYTEMKKEEERRRLQRKTKGAESREESRFP